MSRQILKKERIITDRLTLGSYRKEDRDRLAEMMRNPEIYDNDLCCTITSEEVQFYALANRTDRISVRLMIRPISNMASIWTVI